MTEIWWCPSSPAVRYVGQIHADHVYAALEVDGVVAGMKMTLESWDQVRDIFKRAKMLVRRDI